jgi:hypothetical protein
VYNDIALGQIQVARLVLEPITMTLSSIFKKEVERHPYHAWRTLGSINKLGNVKYKKRKDHSTTSDRSSDYHFVLDIIFASLWEAQSSGGILWNLWYQGKTTPVCLKIPVFLVICDSEGADKLCRKYTNRSLKVNKICRYDCTCPTDQLDEPNTTKKSKLIYT